MVVFTKVAKVEKILLLRSVEGEQPRKPVPGDLFVLLPPRVRPSRVVRTQWQGAL